MKYLIFAILALLVLGACSPEGTEAQITGEATGSELLGEVVEVNKAESSFEFEGFAPGKSHAGTFDIMEGNLFLENGVVVGAEGTIDATSVNTGIEKLDGHLKNDDFFDVENYPTIKVENMVIENDVMTGSLTFHGITKTVSFPVSVEGSSVSAEFLLDITQFEMKYLLIDDDVRIKFNLVS